MNIEQVINTLPLCQRSESDQARARNIIKALCGLSVSEADFLLRGVSAALEGAARGSMIKE